MIGFKKLEKYFIFLIIVIISFNCTVTVTLVSILFKLIIIKLLIHIYLPLENQLLSISQKSLNMSFKNII